MNRTVTKRDRTCHSCALMFYKFENNRCPFCNETIKPGPDVLSKATTDKLTGDKQKKSEGPKDEYEYHSIPCPDGLEDLYPDELQPEYLEDHSSSNKSSPPSSFFAMAKSWIGKAVLGPNKMLPSFSPYKRNGRA